MSLIWKLGSVICIYSEKMKSGTVDRSLHIYSLTVLSCRWNGGTQEKRRACLGPVNSLTNITYDKEHTLQRKTMDG